MCSTCRYNSLTCSEDNTNGPGSHTHNMSFRVIFLGILIILNVKTSWRSIWFPRVHTACKDQIGLEKRSVFMSKSQAYIFLMIVWYNVAGQENAKSVQNFRFLDQSDLFKIHQKKNNFFILSLRLGIFATRN